MKSKSKFIIRKEILDTDGKFIAYKYYFRTIDKIPEWVDEESSAMRFDNEDIAWKAIEDMRFLVIARMSVKEIKS